MVLLQVVLGKQPGPSAMLQTISVSVQLLYLRVQIQAKHVQPGNANVELLQAALETQPDRTATLQTISVNVRLLYRPVQIPEKHAPRENANVGLLQHV